MPINFSEKVESYFKDASWKIGRDVRASYSRSPIISEIPTFLKDFLYEYGNLLVIETDVIDNVPMKMEIFPSFFEKISESEDEWDYIYEILGYEIYLFAHINSAASFIGCDANGRIYMLGDVCSMRGEIFEQGIENVLTDDWSMAKQLNEGTGDWE